MIRCTAMRFVVALAVALWVAPGYADSGGDVEIARRRFQTGQALFQRGRYTEALAEFEAAKAMVKSPAFDFNIGMCLANMDRPTEAADALERYITAKPEDPDSASIWRKIAELRQDAARRAAATRPPPPEAHAPIVTTPPPLPPAHDARRTRTRVAIGVAAAAGAILVAAAVTGGLALAKRGDYDRGCDQGRCDPSLYDGAHGLAIGTDVLIGLGVAAAITSVVLFATRPRATHAAAPPHAREPEPLRAHLAPFATSHAGGLALVGEF
jgi:tetratricopeptide (TPR) repeat protein